MLICSRLVTIVMSPANNVEKKQTMRFKNQQGTSGVGVGIVKAPEQVKLPVEPLEQAIYVASTHKQYVPREYAELLVAYATKMMVELADANRMLDRQAVSKDGMALYAEIERLKAELATTRSKEGKHV